MFNEEKKKTKNFDYKLKIKKVLILSLLFFMMEFIYGIFSNSLGLLSDSIHMLFDSSTLLISYFCINLENKKPSSKFPYRLKKIEYLASFFNSILLWYTSFNIIKKSIYRLFYPEKVNGFETLFISFLGILINILGLFFFKDDFNFLHSNHNHSHGNEENKVKIKNNHLLNDKKKVLKKNQNKSACHDHLNIESIILHLIGDLFGSISLIISSLLIIFYEYYKFDSIASIIISILIFFNSYRIMFKSYNNLVNSNQNKLLKNEIFNLSKKLKNSKEIKLIDGFSLKNSFIYGSNKLVFILDIITKEKIDYFDLSQNLRYIILKFKKKSKSLKDAFINLN